MNIDKALDKIANGLGVAVDKIYPVMYKQAMIEGVWDVIWIVVFLVLFAAIAIWIRIVFKKQKAEEEGCVRVGYRYSDGDWDWDEPRQAVLLVISVTIVIIGLIAVPICAYDAVTAFFNTDYYIVKDILNQINK